MQKYILFRKHFFKFYTGKGDDDDDVDDDYDDVPLTTYVSKAKS